MSRHLKGCPGNGRVDLDRQESALRFPCSFPLKVMGRNAEAFSAAVGAIFDKHVSFGEISYSRKLSSGDKYLSLTVTFTAQSKEHLDALYQELNAHELVLMAF